jgi:hypothetical protein
LSSFVLFVRSIGQGAFGEVFHGYLQEDPEDTAQEMPIAAKVSQKFVAAAPYLMHTHRPEISHLWSQLQLNTIVYILTGETTLLFKAFQYLASR